MRKSNRSFSEHFMYEAAVSHGQENSALTHAVGFRVQSQFARSQGVLSYVT